MLASREVTLTARPPLEPRPRSPVRRITPSRVTRYERGRVCGDDGVKSVEVPSFSVTVYVAGSVADAETGVAVGLVHYQRFPSSPEAIWDRAKTIAETLMDDLY